MEARNDKKRRRQARFVYGGFGFPVVLTDVPMIRVRGVWTPDVNYERLREVLLAVLAEKPARFTGDEVRFVRLSFDMTLQEFADRFGVTHPAVLKWERAGGKSTAMTWAIEKDIRLFLLSRRKVKAVQFLKVYRELEEQPRGPREPVKLHVPDVA